MGKGRGGAETKRVLLFKEKNNENPALLWKSSSYSSLASPSPALVTLAPPFPHELTTPHLEQSLVSCKMELMEQAAGTALA